MIERPFDLINQFKGQDILVELRNGKIISGQLLTFDINVNVALDHAETDDKRKLGLIFIRGDSIISISQSFEKE